MKVQQLMLTAAAMTMGTALAVAGQAPKATQQSDRTPAPAAQDKVTLVGCVEFEQDFRKRMAAGRGGALGTGVGASNEFVLTNVRPASAAVGTTGERSGRSAQEATTGSGAGGGVYALTGSQEQNLKRDVGRQVEVVGTIENAGKSSTGADVTDISDLPRINIQTWHPVGDFCPGK